MKKTVALVLLLMVLMSGTVFAKSIVEQRTVMSGTVTKIVRVGDIVREGEVLLYISSLVGNSVASRATTDGIVLDVMVKVGDNISGQQVVIKLETK